MRWLGLVLLATVASANAQWQMQDSHSTAGLRGIHSVNGTIAWASGTEGTVLRTTDGGHRWQKCPVPPGAEKLDFRGIWAWDADNAVIMSSGPAELSRLYKTTDACAHWTLLQTNSEKDGFWDVIAFRGKAGVLIGDPVRGKFYTAFLGPDLLNRSENKKWSPDEHACTALAGDGAFAASNSSVVVFGPHRYILGTGGKSGPRVLLSPALAGKKDCVGVSMPVANGNESSGVFSLAFRNSKHGIAVGGDYKRPAESAGSAAWTSDGGWHWTAASKPPHGFRSSVAWDPSQKAWIAAGTNGSDISHDDGRTWQSLDDGNWNALSLPFVVGPKGRIGRLRDKFKQ